MAFNGIRMLRVISMPFSAVRELTRVATPATEAAWVAAAQDKTLRQIEDLVADRRPGDRPDDPPSPAARMHVVRFELSAETFALLRQARTVLDDEHGTNLPDDAFVAALCGAVLNKAPQAEPTGRAKFQIAVTVCERCRQGWQEGAGARIAIDAAAVDRALCDAQHIGSIDGEEPERAHQDIPPSVARLVWRRDDRQGERDVSPEHVGLIRRRQRWREQEIEPQNRNEQPDATAQVTSRLGAHAPNGSKARAIRATIRVQGWNSREAPARRICAS
jgi:hypothetical protein